MSSQKGSSHIVLVVALVIVIIGALGYVFWQNSRDNADQSSNAKTTESDTTANEKVTEQATAPESEFMSFSDDATGYSLSYPKEWGTLKAAQTQSRSNSLGVNGDNTKALASADDIVRIRVFTEQSFYFQNNSGYVIRYQGGVAMGAEAGTETYSPVSPVAGTTNVYSTVVGETGPVSVTQHGLFFRAGASVVYVDAGSSEETMKQIAASVKAQ